MSDNICTLNSLEKNETGYVLYLENEGALRRRLQDIGIIDGTEIECVGNSPFGDPKAYIIRGVQIALRNSDAVKIKIKKLQNKD